MGLLCQGDDSCLLHSHCSLSLRRLSLSSCSKSLSCMASEHCSSFEDSSSIACNSSVISCMSVAVCLALSLKLLHNFTIGLAVVTVFTVDLATFFFPLLKGFIAFPLSLISYLVLPEQLLKFGGSGLLYYLSL